MLESLRQLLRNRSKSVELKAMKAWAASRGFSLRTVHEDEGCLVEPAGSPPAWRIEWGLSHRDYIPGRELRIIGETGTPKELVAMVLTRGLKEEMEKQVFEQYVEDVQTRLDTETPAEMRWLVLYPQVHAAELDRLRDRYAAVCSAKSWMALWLAGPLNDALAATMDVADASEPMVLMLTRGRLTLRTPMQAADPRLLATWLSVFEHALSEARRLAREWHESPEGSQSTHPATWAGSSLVDDT